MKLAFFQQITKIMKIRPVGAEFFHADGRTDMSKLTASFRNFANAPQRGLLDMSQSNSGLSLRSKPPNNHCRFDVE